MATTATAQTATITPLSSSHGDANGFQWDFATAPAKDEAFHRQYNYKPSLPDNSTAANGTHRAPLSANNGNVVDAEHESAQAAVVNASDGDTLGHDHSNDEDAHESMTGDSLDNVDENHYGRIDVDGRKRTKGQEWSDEDSKWIHRDKLAKIESEELQAAGFILPAARSRSKRRGDRSLSRNRSAADSARKAKDSSLEPTTPDTTAVFNGWANEADDDQPARPTTGSRIPVPKKSPALPRTLDDSPEELDKRMDSSQARSRSNSTTLKNLDPTLNAKTQSTKRAGIDATPKKATPTPARGASIPSKSIPPEARGKPKPKNKSTTHGSGSSARPSTRDGLRDSSSGSVSSKQMEGDPPWMINAYKPDPRLPPDQQLLPTVARRLAQEKWEQEGKFGNIYDKEFRPITDEGYLQPPVAEGPSSVDDNIVHREIEAKDEWPLKAAEPKSPSSLGRSSTYSTMPKIQDKPSSLTSTIPSSRPVQDPMPNSMPNAMPNAMPPPSQPIQITRVPDVEKQQPPDKAAKNKEGCGCCIVM